MSVCERECLRTDARVYVCARAHLCSCEGLSESAFVTHVQDSFPLLGHCMLLSLVLTIFSNNDFRFPILHVDHNLC